MRSDLKTPHVQVWNWSCLLMWNTVTEVPTGNKASNIWHTYNSQRSEHLENGFVDEFRNAQRNLTINEAAASPVLQQRPCRRSLPISKPRSARGESAGARHRIGFTTAPSPLTDLCQGEAGRLAGRLRGSNYICRMVGNNPSRARRATTGAGPSDELLHRDPTLSAATSPQSSTTGSVTTTRCRCSSAAGSPRA
jgi:hypothetical protein